MDAWGWVEEACSPGLKLFQEVHMLVCQSEGFIKVWFWMCLLAGGCVCVCVSVSCVLRRDLSCRDAYRRWHLPSILFSVHIPCAELRVTLHCSVMWCHGDSSILALSILKTNCPWNDLPRCSWRQTSRNHKGLWEMIKKNNVIMCVRATKHWQDGSVLGQQEC